MLIMALTLGAAQALRSSACQLRRSSARLTSARRIVCAAQRSHEPDDDGSTRAWAAFEVVHEDAAMIVVNKGDGLLAVPGRGEHKADCLLSRLLHERGTEVFAPHRLDRDTSGLIVLAKTKPAHRTLSIAFEARQVRKRYIGTVLGLPAELSGVIDLPIGKSLPGELGPRMRVFDFGSADARPSITRWTLASTDVERGTAKLVLEPVTGRAQQLRVHLASAGLPLIGDALHGPPTARALSERLCLHAAELAFDHPTTGERVSFSSTEPF